MSNVFANLDWSILTDALLSIIPALICITFHELSHGFVALKLGDTTAKDMGRLTLNPIKHIDIWGLIMMALFGFGWAKPVPVNPNNFKRPKRDMAITALAGPVSNILLAVVFSVLTAIVAMALGNFDSVRGFVLSLMLRMVVLSIGLAVFNMIPIPPLDGSKVLFAFLPDKAYAQLMRVERFGFIILFVILRTNVLDSTIGAATRWIMNLMYGIINLLLTLFTTIFG